MFRPCSVLQVLWRSSTSIRLVHHEPGTAANTPLRQIGCRLVLSAAPAGPDHFRVTGTSTVEHVLIVIQFASDITGLAAAITTLVDAALRRPDKQARND
jgi:hypothetical protein